MRPLLIATLVALAAAPGAVAQERTIRLLSGVGAVDPAPRFTGASDDATRIAFLTPEKLLPTDTDTAVDAYLSTPSGLVHVSRSTATPPLNANTGAHATPAPVSADGSTVTFSTAEALVPEDKDEKRDAYLWRDGEVQRLAGGSNVATEAKDMTWYGMAADGSRHVLGSAERLAGDDVDDTMDLYDVVVGGAPRLLTPGTGMPVDVRAISRDASRVFFETSEQLAATGDTDGTARDVFVTTGGVVRHVSRAVAGGGSGGPVALAAAAADGGSALLLGTEKLSAFDQDTFNDLFLRRDAAGDGGTTEQVSAGSPPSGNGAHNVVFHDAAEDLSAVFFVTAERLTEADQDGEASDLYRWTAAGTTLVSAGHEALSVVGGAGRHVSDDGRRAIFLTAEALTTEDTDKLADLYEWADGSLRLVTVADGVPTAQAVEAGRGMISGDGRRVLWTSEEPYTREDVDSTRDLYVREDGRTELLTPGRAAFDASYVTASADGLRTIVLTAEALAAADKDGGLDLYEITRPPRSRPEPAAAAPDTRAPVLSGVRINRARFRPRTTRRPRISARRAPLGATISFTSDESGSANIAFGRVVGGRVSRGRCVKPARALRRARRCTRITPVPGRIRVTSVHAGRPVRVTFYGRLDAGRRLRRGRYAAFVRAYDSAGNGSALGSTRRFSIVRR